MKHEYRHLKIWTKAREVNKQIYKLSSTFPKEEKYGLVSQIRRASISIASNISEGSSYETAPMFRKYLDIALGSLCEVETQLYLAHDVSYIDENYLQQNLTMTDELKRMILGFKKSIQ